MILLVDCGNSRIKWALFADGQLRPPVFPAPGEGLSESLRAQGVLPEMLKDFVLFSVAPHKTESLLHQLQVLLGREGLLLTGERVPGFRHAYDSLKQLGADRIAAALGAWDCFPGENLLVADFGTAITVDALSSDRVFLGGMILPGIASSLQGLLASAPGLEGAAEGLLPLAESTFTRPVGPGRNSGDALRYGLFYQALGAVREAGRLLSESCFGGEGVRFILAGGAGAFFQEELEKSVYIEDLLFRGMVRFYLMNKEREKCL